MSDSCDCSLSFIKQSDGKKIIDCDDIEIMSNYQEMINQAEELRQIKDAINESKMRERTQELRIEELEKENEDKCKK